MRFLPSSLLLPTLFAKLAPPEVVLLYTSGCYGVAVDMRPTFSQLNLLVGPTFLCTLYDKNRDQKQHQRPFIRENFFGIRFLTAMKARFS